MMEDEDEAEGENSHHVDAQRQQEEEEVAVIPPPDAVVHPGTVVVEVLRTRNTAETVRYGVYSAKVPAVSSVFITRCERREAGGLKAD